MFISILRRSFALSFRLGGISAQALSFEPCKHHHSWAKSQALPATGIESGCLWMENKKKPGGEPGFSMSIAMGQAASSISASSGSISSALPRRGPFCSCASITFSDSVSVSFCTTTISRAMRSSAAS